MTTLAHHWAGRPLAIRPESLATLLQVDGMTPSASRFVGTQPVGSVARITRNGVAVLTIDGVLVNRGQILSEHLGVNSYEGLAYKLSAMGRDRKVKSIILDVESPGGEAVGAFELAATIRAISSQKPTFAIVNGMAASAAYALASACRAIISTPSGVSGSIGVVLLHADYSRALDKAGVTPTLIHAGKHKVDANQFEPLPKDVRGDLQGEVDRFYSMFLNTVAVGRGARLSADAARKTEARTFIGRDAQKVGLVDEIGTFDELLNELERRAA
jgi:signal peptide peptidase SppA